MVQGGPEVSAVLSEVEAGAGEVMEGWVAAPVWAAGSEDHMVGLEAQVVDSDHQVADTEERVVDSVVDTNRRSNKFRLLPAS